MSAPDHDGGGHAPRSMLDIDPVDERAPSGYVLGGGSIAQQTQRTQQTHVAPEMFTVHGSL